MLMRLLIWSYPFLAALKSSLELSLGVIYPFPLLKTIIGVVSTIVSSPPTVSWCLGLSCNTAAFVKNLSFWAFTLLDMKRSHLHLRLINFVQELTTLISLSRVTRGSAFCKKYELILAQHCGFYLHYVRTRDWSSLCWLIQRPISQ